VNVNLGYAYTDAQDRQGTVSSQAISNFEETVRAISTQNILAPSQFSTRHNVTLATTFSQEFVKDLPTRFAFFVSAREGNPYSYVFDNPSVFGELDREDNILLYVPTGIDDPNVDFSNTTDEEEAEIFDFLERSGLSEFAGGVAPRNEFRDPWFVDVDFRFQQDLPMPIGGLRTIFYIDVENVLNLIDSGSNVLREVNRGDVGEGVPVFDVDGVNDQGQYIIDALESNVDGLFGLDPNDPDDGFEVVSNQSLWAVQFGLRFEF
ncbi:MAG: hypothetical protein AAF742_04725, partial [Pseudomonadota bacterium]